MDLSPADFRLLAALVPVNALSAEHLRKLADKAAIEDFPSGHVLFQEGSTDNEAFYVLAGDVVLSSEKNDASRTVSGASEEARYPLANPACGMPVVGFLRIAPFVQLAFISAMNFPRRAALPRPSAHIFYHRRVKDARDRLPKISGYGPSELYASRLVLAGMVGSRST